MSPEDPDGSENTSCVCTAPAPGSFKDRGKTMLFWLCFSTCQKLAVVSCICVHARVCAGTRRRPGQITG